jgi:ABC-type iron transport system FetAB permease component
MAPKAPLRKPAASVSNNPLTILSTLTQQYTTTTPSRTKLIDAFLAFLVFTGIVQFAYCVLAGNYVFQPNSPLPICSMLITGVSRSMHS